MRWGDMIEAAAIGITFACVAAAVITVGKRVQDELTKQQRGPDGFRGR